MKLRSYVPSDCASMAQLFYETVHAVNACDYPEEQLNVWATGSVDMEKWDRSYRSTRTVIAEENGEIIGFGNMDRTGYLDMLYVHKDHQREGVATAICDELESCSAAVNFTVHASITARAFFEKRGYRMVCRNIVERGGLQLINYIMTKE